MEDFFDRFYNQVFPHSGTSLNPVIQILIILVSAGLSWWIFSAVLRRLKKKYHDRPFFEKSEQIFVLIKRAGHYSILILVGIGLLNLFKAPIAERIFFAFMIILLSAIANSIVNILIPYLEQHLADKTDTQVDDVILDLSKTEYIDSTGIGVLIQVQRQARAADRLLVLLAPSPFVSRNLSMMRLDKFFHIAPNLTAAEQWVRQRAGRSAPAVEEAGEDKAVWWEGEVTALHIDELREQMSKVLDNREPGDMVIVDLSRVSFIDSSGLGLMISLKKRALSQGVTLAFRNPTEAVANVLKIAALDMYLLGEKLE